MPTYYRGDERPAWVATVTVNGTAEDYTTGYTFEVKLIDSAGATALTKTTGITGATGGAITVAWSTGQLDLTAGVYTAQLKVLRSSDSYDFTITERLVIKARY